MTMTIAISMVGLGLLVAAEQGSPDSGGLSDVVQVVELPSSTPGGGHGAAVAISGNLAVVGRPFDVDTSGPVGGAVDVYQRIAGEATLEGLPWSWEFLCRLAPSVPIAGSRFGSAVDIDGATVVVGSWSDDRAGVNAGVAWVFTIPESPGGVVTSDALLAPVGQMEGDYFGWDVAIDGDVIVVGGWGADIQSIDDHAGAAWVFEREDGVFLERATLTAGPHVEAAARFGSSVAIESGLIVVGEPKRSSGGAVYLFADSDGEWPLIQQIENPEGHAGDEFGAAVCIGHSRIDQSPQGMAVGAPGDGELGALAGAVWLFSLDVDGTAYLSETGKVVSISGGPWHRAGSSVAGYLDDVDSDHDGEDDGDSLGAVIFGSPSWVSPDDGMQSGALFAYSGEDEEDEEGDDFFRLDLPRFADGGLGASVDLSLSVVPDWGFETTTLIVGDPLREDGHGGVILIDVPDVDGDGDCNENGRFDAMELLLEPGQHDCDADGEMDACQLRYDWFLDCDENGQLDSCDIAADPSGNDCDGDGVLDVCQLASDPAADCDGNGVLDECQLPDGSAEGSDWMVEWFFGGIDLQGLGIRLVPIENGSSNWSLCTQTAYDVWIDPMNHTQLFLADDESQSVAIPFDFEFGGTTYTNLWIGSNGYVTFGEGDTVYEENLAEHFSLPRLSVLFDDLDPTAGGSVLYGIGPANSFVVSWIDVPEWEVAGTLNTLQLVIHPDGAIEMSWPSLTATTGIAGPSFGGGIPQPFALTDLSNAFDCVARPVVEAEDCNQNGVLDVCEATPAGDPFWASEYFLGDFDLPYQRVTFTPTNSSTPPQWQVCSEPTSGFLYEAVNPTVLQLEDDDNALVAIGFDFAYAGSVWSDLFVNSNGSLTFGTADYGYNFSLPEHFSQPRISGLFVDLIPADGGVVWVNSPASGVFVVTWDDVPFFIPGIGNASFQIALYESGVVEMAWLNITPPECTVGLSDGNYIPYGFAETDLSMAGSSCQLVQPWNDCDGNGVHDGIQIALECDYDYDGDGVLDICGNFLQGMPDACPTEVTGDGLVDVRDLLAVLMAWGDVKPLSQSARCDFGPGKGDFRVDLFDLMEVIEGMRVGCPGQP
ncbi:MAG: hypothetical protein GY876_07225 [Planctomycetes bacterium]|nr:hypothetical protein [Planctomycetota bacterium]